MKIFANILHLVLLTTTNTFNHAASISSKNDNNFQSKPKMVSEPPPSGRRLAQMIPQPKGSEISTHNAFFLGNCSPEESFVFKISAGDGHGAIGIIDSIEKEISLDFLQNGEISTTKSNLKNSRIDVVASKQQNFFALENDDGRAFGIPFEFKRIPNTGAWVELRCSSSSEVVVVYKDDSPMQDVEAEVLFAPGSNKQVKETVRLKNRMTTKTAMSAIGKQMRKQPDGTTRSLESIASIDVVDSNNESIVIEHSKEEKEVVLVQMEFEDVNNNLIQRTLIMETRSVPEEAFEVMAHATVNDDGDVELRFDGLPSGKHYLISARLGITSENNNNDNENSSTNDVELQANELESSLLSIESVRGSSSSHSFVSSATSSNLRASVVSPTASNPRDRTSNSASTTTQEERTTATTRTPAKMIEVVDTKAMLDTDDAVLTIHGAWFRNKIHESDFSSMMGDDWSVKVLEVQIQDPDNGYEQVGVLSIHQAEVDDSRLYIRDLDHRRRLSSRPSDEEHGVVTDEMSMGRVPSSLFSEKESNLRHRKLQESTSGALLLVHGYCATNPWPTSQFTGDAAFHVPNESGSNQWSHDLFARYIGLFGSSYDSCGIVAHSQGGAASLHLYSYYWSCLDNASSGRLIQSVGTPYQGTPLAGNLALIGDIFGAGCGKVTDLTTSGASSWLSGIPSWARAKVNYYTTSFEDNWWSYDYCNIATDLVLSNPEDGTTEKSRGQLPGAVNRGNKKDWCHTRGMKETAQYYDSKRNAEMNAYAAR